MNDEISSNGREVHKYQIVSSKKYRKDLKSVVRRGCNMELMDYVVNTLASGEGLPAKYLDHALTGNWAKYRECHITPDWLLVYKIEKNILVLTLTRTGTHSDIF
ncbi:MAG: type II toxin-antitoxin system YafQ family toxin [Oscillospiraceae bacterium]|nr:type II toxin-antitoxin system YafQ family toxin [Oscillospiraceae bacterium]